MTNTENAITTTQAAVLARIDSDEYHGTTTQAVRRLLAANLIIDRAPDTHWGYALTNLGRAALAGVTR